MDLIIKKQIMDLIIKKQKMMRSVRMNLFRVKCSAKRAFIPFLLLITLMMFLYILCLSIGGISFFYTFIYKIAFSLGGRAIAVVLCKVGCSGSLALAIGYAVKSIILIEANMINPSGGELIPSNSGSGGPSHSNSWTEDSFGIRVLMEPFSETEMEGTSARSSVARDEAGPSHQGRDEARPSHQEYVVQNRSLESSMQNRVVRLEQDDSPYLLGKAKGTYWSDIRLQLEHAPSQKEYNRLLEFENRDLQIRELRHECLRLFEGVLKDHPTLADQAPYTPQEAFNDFLDQRRVQLDRRFHFLITNIDGKELESLDKVRQKLKQDGPAYVLEIFRF
jgi:hypothetical protein